MTEEKIYTGKDLVTLASALLERSRLAANLGKQFDGERDLYKALGYPQAIVFGDYLGRYQRQDIAKRIVNRPAEDTWRTQATLLDGEKDKDTPFLSGWQTLVRKKGVWRYLSQVDRLAGIGRFGVLLVGFAGGGKLKEPVAKAAMKGPQDLLYMRAFHEGEVTVDSFDRNTASERFGLPEMYSIAMGDGQKEEVHWTRVIHVAEDSFDDVYGTPRLEAVFNRLNDLEKVIGGSAEATWKLMRKGFVLDVSPDYEIDPDTEAAMLEQVEEFEHGLRRFMLTRGLTPHDLGSEVVDPKGLFEALIALIAGATGIPQRILLGSERGELASSQDEANWAAIVEARREQFAEPFILRAFVDRMLWAGVLPLPAADEYGVQWESLFQLTDKEKAEIAKTLSEALTVLLSAGFAVEDAIAFLGAVPHVVGFKLAEPLSAPAEQPAAASQPAPASQPGPTTQEQQPRRRRYVRLAANERRTALAVAEQVTDAAALLADVLVLDREQGEPAHG